LSIARGCQMVCFQTKNPNLGKFWRCNWRCGYILRTLETILWSFVIF
jgi:hypothetical protein